MIISSSIRYEFRCLMHEGKKRNSAYKANIRTYQETDTSSLSQWLVSAIYVHVAYQSLILKQQNWQNVILVESVRTYASHRAYLPEWVQMSLMKQCLALYLLLPICTSYVFVIEIRDACTSSLASMFVPHIFQLPKLRRRYSHTPRHPLTSFLDLLTQKTRTSKDETIPHVHTQPHSTYHYDILAWNSKRMRNEFEAVFAEV